MCPAYIVSLVSSLGEKSMILSIPMHGIFCFCFFVFLFFFGRFCATNFKHYSSSFTRIRILVPLWFSLLVEGLLVIDYIHVSLFCLITQFLTLVTFLTLVLMHQTLFHPSNSEACHSLSTNPYFSSLRGTLGHFMPACNPESCSHRSWTCVLCNRNNVQQCTPKQSTYINNDGNM